MLVYFFVFGIIWFTYFFEYFFFSTAANVTNAHVTGMMMFVIKEREDASAKITRELPPIAIAMQKIILPKIV